MTHSAFGAKAEVDEIFRRAAHELTDMLSHDQRALAYILALLEQKCQAAVKELTVLSCEIDRLKAENETMKRWLN